jgi:GNAT superfamily N-acetyltransferase
MLDAAVNWDDSRPAVAVAETDIAHYVGSWPREGDAGVVAYDVDGGSPVGAAWYRFFPSDDHGYGFVDESVPEVSIAVDRAMRGRGIGTDLLRALAEIARRRGIDALSLSVERANRARALYEREGYVAVGDASSDGALTMVLRLSHP